jgi:hypothetical protein
VLIKTATGFHADGFGGGDLHVVDVMVVPERFEQAVGKRLTRMFCTVSLPR